MQNKTQRKKIRTSVVCGTTNKRRHINLTRVLKSWPGKAEKIFEVIMAPNFPYYKPTGQES